MRRATYASPAPASRTYAPQTYSYRPPQQQAYVQQPAAPQYRPPQPAPQQYYRPPQPQPTGYYPASIGCTSAVDLTLRRAR